MKTLTMAGFALLFGLGIMSMMSCKSSQKAARADMENTDPRTLSTVPQNGYDIPAQRFDETAQAIMHASGCGIEADLQEIGAVRVNAVKGKMSIWDAVKTALKGTGLKMTKVNDHLIKVEKK